MNLFEFCLSFVYVLVWYRLFSSSSSGKVCHLKRQRFYPRINQHSFWVRIGTHLTLKCSGKKNPASLLTNFTVFKAAQKIKKHSLDPFERDYTELLHPSASYLCGLPLHFSGNFISWSLPVIAHQFRRVAGSLWQLRTWHKTSASHRMTEAILFSHFAPPAPSDNI